MKLLIGAILALVLLAAGIVHFKHHPQSLSHGNFKANNGCSNFDNENACKTGSQTDNPQDWISRDFQTPPRDHSLWRAGYQDYNIIRGQTQVRYSSDRRSARVVFYTQLNPRILNSSSTFTQLFSFGGQQPQTSNEFKATSADFSGKLLNAKSVILDGNGRQIASLEVEPVDFIWNHPAVNQPPQYKGGQKGAIIEMFGWPYEEIEKECASLGKMGQLGVKVFPPQEAILDFEHPENGELNPWSWLYQPVSYKLNSRMGTSVQLRKMINTCRTAGVRVYADAVVNHMSGNGNDMFPRHCIGNNYWGNKNSSGGSPFYTQGFAYENWQFTGQRPGNEFPSVPYGPLDFHCARGLSSWTDPFILNYGWLVNLCDLNTESEYVRQRIADQFTDLLSIGFSGFRIDAAKHISPDNLAAIFKKFKDNLGGGDLPEDFITYLEVIIGGEKDLLMCADNKYNYGRYFEQSMRAAGLSELDIYKVKIWSSDYPKEFPICGQWAISSERYAIQNECHDDQFPGSSSRDMGDKGSVLVKERNVDKHREFEKQMFLRTDGNWQIRLVLSAYTFMDSVQAFGPPDGLSDCARCLTDACKKSCSKSVPQAPAHDPNSCGYSMYDQSGRWMQGAWTRVHRDIGIVNAMRKWMGLSANASPEELGLPVRCARQSSKSGQYLQE